MNDFIGILNYGLSEPQQSATDHSKLTSLEYEKSGHTGFQPSTDTNLQTVDKTVTGAINELLSKMSTNLIPSSIDGGNTIKGTPKMIFDGGSSNTIYDRNKVLDGGGTKR
ncbi:MAG: hypothetical protein ACRDDY_16435 [Clostridium sp.]|uniref:hypothetical protein n=1 Tax=Clostridium sp. TaxID=1506 RepID=UPI003EE4AE4B